MSQPLRDVGASVRARLLQRARAERIDFQMLLTRYVLERRLYRFSVSEHRDRFILKGARLLSVWAGDRFRPTHSGVKSAHARRFRHTLATALLEKGWTTEDVAIVLGSTPEIIRRHYAQWTTERQERIWNLAQDVWFGKILANRSGGPFKTSEGTGRAMPSARKDLVKPCA